MATLFAQNGALGVDDKSSDPSSPSGVGVYYSKNSTPFYRPPGSGTPIDLSDTGTGGVDTSGTPANNEVAVFVDADTLEGDSNFVWNSTGQQLNLGGGDLIGTNRISTASGDLFILDPLNMGLRAIERAGYLNLEDTSNPGTPNTGAASLFVANNNPDVLNIKWDDGTVETIITQ